MALKKNGKDIPGIVVRAKDGLAGCEYLSDVALLKGGVFDKSSTSTN